MATLPTGTQHELTRGAHAAVVTEMGATLRSYDVAGRPVLDGFAAFERPDGGRGQVLAPWPNRVRDGRYRFGGEELQLALSEVPARNAIHGLVRWVGWALAERGESWVTLTTTVWPQAGYPFLVRLRAAYRLDDDGLRVTLHARNAGDRPAPYGVGQHPYFTVGMPVDDTVLTVPAAQWLRTDDRGNPVGFQDVAGSAYDFTAPRPVGGHHLDTAYSGLARGSDGRAVVRLEHPSGASGVAVWMDEAARHLQVFSGDTLPDPGRRRQGLAVEPMSCPPGAFASGTDLVTLEPGAEHELTWGVHSW
jgi:galactose mutarotase-like enzyme